MCKSLTNYFPRNNDFLVTYFGKTQILLYKAHFTPDNFIDFIINIFYLRVVFDCLELQFR